jgi:hypothetical protein
MLSGGEIMERIRRKDRLNESEERKIMRNII